MKLTFRDLKQQKFSIDADPSETIGQVKEKIAQEKGWDAGQQKLIYSGKILQDANTVESYKIEEKGFVVCMVSKPKPPQSSAKTPSTPAPKTPAIPAAPAPASNPPAAVPTTPSPAPQLAPAASAFNDPSAFMMGPQGAGVVAEMEAMGFPRPEIERAMRAAFFNPDRAIEYLLSGIPESADQPAPAASPAPAAEQAPAAASSAPTSGDEPVNLFEAAAQAGSQPSGARAAAPRQSASGGEGGLANLDVLRNSTHFQQFRQLVQQQPQMLEPVLQQLGAGNPQLAQLIANNPEQFLQLLSEDVDEEGGAVPPGAQVISVTEDERDAIERLCLLGFSREAVIQAYFACDRNEELAANFLFDQPEEDD